jgi:hypothetical protein
MDGSLRLSSHVEHTDYVELKGHVVGVLDLERQIISTRFFEIATGYSMS